MSTNGMSSWAVDLGEIGAVYPFQGWEVVMVIIGVAFWLGWHVIQLGQENREVRREMDADPRGDEARRAIERY